MPGNGLPANPGLLYSPGNSEDRSMMTNSIQPPSNGFRPLAKAVATLLGAACVAVSAADRPTVPRGQPIKPVRSKPPAESATATNAAPRVETPAPTSAVASVGFDILSTFKYEVPEEGGAGSKPAPNAPDPDAQIPANVKAYNGKKIALKGFMLPLKVEGGLVTELLLMRDQSMCCFGTVPKINEWVAVKMTGGGVKPVMDQAVTLSGTIKIGAMRENGYLVGIYQMDGDKMDAHGAL
jgi:hypothetical protein